MSFCKGFSKGKRKAVKGSNDSEPAVTNQMSTFNSENERLDPGAYTETKTASRHKKKSVFVAGVKGALKDIGPQTDDCARLYPGPNQPWNISGSDKVAMRMNPTMPKPPKEAVLGHTGIKPEASPARVTPTTRPGNPINGQWGLTGARGTATFNKPVRSFGAKTFRSRNLQAMSKVKGLV